MDGPTFSLDRLNSSMSERVVNVVGPSYGISTIYAALRVAVVTPRAQDDLYSIWLRKCHPSPLVTSRAKASSSSLWRQSNRFR